MSSAKKEQEFAERLFDALHSQVRYCKDVDGDLTEVCLDGLADLRQVAKAMLSEEEPCA